MHNLLETVLSMIHDGQKSLYLKWLLMNLQIAKWTLHTNLRTEVRLKKNVVSQTYIEDPCSNA